MMTFETIAFFAFTEFLMSLSPGPAVLLVVGLSMRSGFRIGFMATLGILSVNIVYFTLSALGIGALILASSTLFTLLKWIGAAYLAYLGLQMITPLIKQRFFKGQATIDDFNLDEARKAAPRKKETELRTFTRGFILQASNPKNLAFFVAILPQFITPGGGDIALQMAVLGVVSVLLELPILVMYGMASAWSASLMKARLIEWIEGIGGVLLICMGGLLAAYRRVN